MIYNFIKPITKTLDLSDINYPYKLNTKYRYKAGDKSWCRGKQLQVTRIEQVNDEEYNIYHEEI